MLHKASRATFVAVSTCAALWFATGPATAATPQQCEQEEGMYGPGRVDWLLDPADPNGYEAICYCRGGFYDDQQVIGAHVAMVANAPYAMHCGLGYAIERGGA